MGGGGQKGNGDEGQGLESGFRMETDDWEAMIILLSVEVALLGCIMVIYCRDAAKVILSYRE